MVNVRLEKSRRLITERIVADEAAIVGT